LSQILYCGHSTQYSHLVYFVTHAGIVAGMGRVFSRVCLFVCCLTVCFFVHALKGKRLELSTPNLVHVCSIAVARHALTQRSKGQRSRSHVMKTVTFARLLVPWPVFRIPMCYRRPLPAWVCMSIRLPTCSIFSFYFYDAVKAPA